MSITVFDFSYLQNIINERNSGQKLQNAQNFPAYVQVGLYLKLKASGRIVLLLSFPCDTQKKALKFFLINLFLMQKQILNSMDETIPPNMFPGIFAFHKVIIRA